MDLIKENEKLERALALSRHESDKNNIGVQKEHTLHRVIKFYLTETLDNQEIPIGRMFADVKIDNTIYEVQTKAFNALRNKLDVFLKDYDVIIVHPMAFNKYYYLTNEFGEVIKENKSPRHIYPLEVMWELYKIKNYLKDSHLHFKLIMMDMDEIRLEKEKRRYHSKGFERENQIPKKIIDLYDISTPKDWLNILNLYDLPDNFDSKIFSKKCHLTLRKGTTALNVLNYLEVVERIGKKGNSYIYKIKTD